MAQRAKTSAATSIKPKTKKGGSKSAKPALIQMPHAATVAPLRKPRRASDQDWQLIDLSKFHDPRGTLSVIQGGEDIPFEISRVFYLYDVPGGSSRAAHANQNCHQFLIAMSGSFDVHLDNGFKQESFHLNRSYYGLYIPPMTWRDIDNFSSGAVCMALASHPYNSQEYYRDYDEFIAAVTGK